MAGQQRRSLVGSSTRVDHETDGADAPSPSSTDWLLRGQTIGRYLVLECLGVGGMGVIYSAWDPKLDRKLAIKVVRGRHGKLGTTRGRARLLREGQALARLRHPNVISVHDVGTHEGRVFVAMEFVEGQTLYRWLQRNKQPPVRQLIETFLQVGRGLAAAHRADLVHRDVKPENVMLGADGRVMVVDFGIAREGLVGELESDDDEDGDGDDEPAALVEPEPDERPASCELEPEPEPGVPSALLEDHTPLAALTRVGAVVGTPAYMSPEQHRGRQVDARSDQFSFCVAMWEALNGEKPYGEGSRQKLLARMRLGQLRRFRNREVPRRIVLALHRGLAWHPRDRHVSMEALLEALNPRGHSAERRLWHGLGIGSVGGVLIGVIATILSVGLRPSASPEPPACAEIEGELDPSWSEARAAEIGARFEATGLERAAASWGRTRARLDGWAQRWIRARARACSDHFVARRDSAASHDHRVACLELQREAFDALLELLTELEPGELDGALAAVVELPDPGLCAEPEHLRGLQRQLEEPSSPLARRRVTELRSELERLDVRLELGHWHDDLERSRQLLAAAREADEPALLTRALLIHAAFLGRSGDALGAEALALEAARVAAADGTFTGAETEAEALRVAADSLSVRDRHHEASRWLELAAALGSRLAPSHPLRVRLAETRAAIDRRQGRLEAAREGLVELRARLEREGDPQLRLAPILGQLAAVELELGETTEAVTLLRRALTLAEHSHGPTHPRVAALRRRLAAALDAHGEPEAALGEYERALILFEHIDGSGRETAAIRSLIGATLARHGRCGEAWPPLSRAVDEAREHAPGSRLLANNLEALAGACRFTHAEAPQLAHEAVELRERLQGPTHPAHPELGRALALEALALLAAGRPGPALPAAQRAAQLLTEAEHPHRRGLAHAALGLSLAALARDQEARPALELAARELAPGSELAGEVSRALANSSEPNE